MRKRISRIILCCFALCFLCSCESPKVTQKSISFDYKRSPGVEQSELYDITLKQMLSNQTINEYLITVEVRDGKFTNTHTARSSQKDICTIQYYAPEADSQYIEKALVMHCEDKNQSFDHYVLLEEDGSITVTSDKPK